MFFYTIHDPMWNESKSINLIEFELQTHTVKNTAYKIINII